MKNDHGGGLTGAEMAEMLDEFANKASKKDIEEFVEQLTCRTHRTLQQRIFGVFLSAIRAWGEDRGGHDARNEATVGLCSRICAQFDKYDMTMPFI